MNSRSSLCFLKSYIVIERLNCIKVLVRNYANDAEYDKAFEKFIKSHKTNLIRRNDPTLINDRRLFVNNLPFDIRGPELKKIMEFAGKITRSWVLINQETGKSTGSATVVFAEPESAKKAIQMFNNARLRSNVISVAPGIITNKFSYPNAFDSGLYFGGENGYEFENDNIGYKVIVKNIPFQMTKTEIVRHFSSVGSVIDISIARTKEGIPKGTALITYAYLEEAEESIKQFNNTKLGNNVLKVFGKIYE